MKKKILILVVIPFLLIICFNPAAQAMTSEEGTAVNDPGLHTYMQWFNDFSGVLSVATTAVNNSGIMEAYVITSVLCTNVSRNFRLCVYDSDEKKFININNENGIGSATRKFTVRTHMDTLHTLWTVSVTDISTEVFYVQISLYYSYDEEAEWIPPGEEDDDSISQEELDKAVKKEIRNTSLSYIAITTFTILLTGAIVIQRKGTGVKAFIKSKLKGDEND